MNKASTSIANPVVHGDIDARTAAASTLSLVFFKTKLVFVTENKKNEPGIYGQIPIDHFNITENGIKEMQDHDFFDLPYQKVWAAVSNQQYAFIPGSLHSREFNQDYLAFQSAPDKRKFSCIKQDNLFTLDLVNVYNMSSALEKFLVRKFPGVSIRHEKSVLALKAPSIGREIGDLLLVNFCHDHLDIVITEKSRLVFFNSFPMRNTDEILYYIFDVLKQLNLRLENLQLRLCGLNPGFIDIDLMTRYLPSLEERITPESMPRMVEPASYFTAYHLNK